MTVATAGGASRAPRPSSLAEVLDVVLDKGIVIDAYIRVAVVGIELITIDARIVIASVDTYLRFAEAVNRLDLTPQQQVGGLPGLVEELREGGAQQKAKGALRGVKDTTKELIEDVRDGDEEEEEERRPRKTAAKRVTKRVPAKRTTPGTKRRREE